MILKASQRADGKQLANHLLNSNDNEHVETHDIRGFVAGNVNDALQEAYAVSRGTRCKQYLFSLSLNPPQDKSVPIADFESAIGRIEQELGLQNQPRCIVFHEKEGRRHAHCVWSRIKNDNGLKAVHLPFFKRKLNTIAKDLFIEHGWKLPKGFEDKQSRDLRNFTLSEWQQAKRNNQNPKAIKATLQQCWKMADSKQAFTNALTDAGYMLARGDKRGYVAVDWHGEVYSLSRATGIKAKALKERLGSPETLASVATTKTMMTKDLKALYKGYSGELKTIHDKEQKPILQQKVVLLQSQKKTRQALKITLKNRRLEETKIRQDKMRKGLRRIWDAMTGKSKATRLQNEREAKAAQKRDAQEKQILIDSQLQQRRTIQTQFAKLRHAQQEDMQTLRAGFIKVLKGHQSLADLRVTFGRAAMDKAQHVQQTYTNDNRPKPELGL